MGRAQRIASEIPFPLPIDLCDMQNVAGIDPLYALSGLVVGVLIGLTGIGGGSLMTPLLVTIFGLNPTAAVGTDLLYAAITKSVGTAVHGFGQNIEWRIVGRLATGSIPATLLTIVTLHHFGAASPIVATVIADVLGGVLLLTATSLALKGPLMRVAMRRRTRAGADAAGTTIAVGFIVGALVSLSSVGAGALGTVALVFLYPRLPVTKIVGSDIAHAVPLTLLAGLGHWWLGAIIFSVLASLLVGSIPGIIIGSLGARFVPERALRPILAVVLTLAAVKMLT